MYNSFFSISLSFLSRNEFIIFADSFMTNTFCSTHCNKKMNVEQYLLEMKKRKNSGSYLLDSYDFIRSIFLANNIATH